MIYERLLSVVYSFPRRRAASFYPFFSPANCVGFLATSYVLTYLSIYILYLGPLINVPTVDSQHGAPVEAAAKHIGDSLTALRAERGETCSNSMLIYGYDYGH